MMLNWERLQIGSRVCKPGMPDDVRLDLFPFGLLLMIRKSDLAYTDILNYRNGFPYCRVIRCGDFMALLTRFGMQKWQLSLFHLARAKWKTPPVAGKDRMVHLHLVVVDPGTGTLMVKRVVPLEPGLSRRILDIIATQDPYDDLSQWIILTRRALYGYTPDKLAVLAELQDHT